MKLTTGILAMAMMAGGAWGQNPDAIDTARSVAKSLQQKQGTETAKPASKPAPGSPAPLVKPAAVAVAKPAAASTGHNQLRRVNVVPDGDDIQVEISSSQAVTPRVSKLSSPARVLVELPETVLANSQNKIPVGSGGVKGVRIGMDGKTPPTTSVVVDLDKAMAYEMGPSTEGKLILTFHAPAAAAAVAKNTPAPAAKKPAVKAPAPAAEPKIAVKTVAAPKVTVAKAVAQKPVAEASKDEPKLPAKTVVAAKPGVVSAAAAAPSNVPEGAKPAKAEEKKAEDKKWAMNGKRDPFFSPVVQQNGSGCSTGKKCLEIGAINLRGVIKSDNGFIAVVTNNLNKAYFLRENDPVFNGYVIKITGDSVTFQETVQDKLGKPLTREIVKKIYTPAV